VSKTGAFRAEKIYAIVKIYNTSINITPFPGIPVEIGAPDSSFE